MSTTLPPPVVHSHEHDENNPPVIAPGHDQGTVTDVISDIVLRLPFTRNLGLGLAVGLFGASVLFSCIAYLLLKGVGIWGINIPVGWGFAIINFVWWIGIGHAGTLISAILLLLRQDWRTSINRYAEAMTIFAVMQAGMFPVIHMGRSWIFYWLFPYPNTMSLWPQPRSALVWDVFAVSTYFTISLVFWYIGMIPDLATLRDRSRQHWKQIFYGALSLGWRGSAYHWHRYELASLLLAGLSTPLVLSVHTVVSWDFASSLVPGWHTTIFPPYFVAGAVYGGFAMVLTLMIPARAIYGLGDIITQRHIDAMCKMLLGTGWIVAYGYIMEIFMGWYSNNVYEWAIVVNRWTGPYKYWYYALWFCNILALQVLWSGKMRRNIQVVWIIAVLINIGMWLERFVIVITSLNRDFLPSSWHMYYPTVWDWLTYLGTLGFFTMLMLLFMRGLPMIAMHEVRLQVPPRGDRPTPRPTPVEAGAR